MSFSQRIELLKEKYESVEDIDLMAGVWLERSVQGGNVPVTLYCIVAEQMYRTIISDRHWYERPNRPNAFTLGKTMCFIIEKNIYFTLKLTCDRIHRGNFSVKTLRPLFFAQFITNCGFDSHLG